ncbi:MAG: hypothetical protein IT204_17940 [Fimbriimonadaceae bacterium]|nr:hypothetical protein [Fimbriimonadaceae bacterium]
MERPTPLLLPAAAAAALAILGGQLLPGSTTPRELLQAGTALLQALSYGCGVLLVRELALRWQRGWGGIGLLGLAAGLAHEGLLAKSLFTPDWPEIGRIAAVGRFLEVNWLWGSGVLLLHLVNAVVLPLLTVELIWPETRHRRLVDDAVLQLLGGGLATAVLFGALTTTARPDRFAYAGGALATLAVVVLARRVSWPVPARSRRRGPFRVGLQAFAAVGGWYLWLLLLPDLKQPLLFTLALTLAALLAVLRRLRETVASGWSDRHSLAAVSGVALFYVGLLPQQAADPGRADDPSGQVLLALATVAGLLALRRRIVRRERQAGGAGGPARGDQGAEPDGQGDHQRRQQTADDIAGGIPPQPAEAGESAGQQP